MKKLLIAVIALLLALPAFALASEVDNSETDVRMAIQEYGEFGIVEIPMISYDGSQAAFEEYNWKNPEIEMLNMEIRAEFQDLYHAFENGLSDINEETYEIGENWLGDYIEILTYPFVDDELVQVIVTSVIYPEIQPDIYTKVRSYNFSKSENRAITLDEFYDALGVTQADIQGLFENWYDFGEYNETLSSFEITGFLYDSKPEEPITRLLIEVMLEMESDPYKRFLMYSYELDMFEWLDSFVLFDGTKYDMFPMSEPLNWENNMGVGGGDYTGLMVSMDTTGFDELTAGREYMLDGVVYVQLRKLAPSYGASEDDAAEIAMNEEGTMIEIHSVAQSEEYTQMLTYPAWIVSYQKGWNEDTTLYTDMIIYTDEADFRVSIAIAADYYEDYEGTINDWFSSVTLVYLD